MSLDHDIDTLNSLITTTIDSALGFERSAEDADAGRFAQFFREFGADRRRVVIRLQDYVSGIGGKPNGDGSLKADLHRRWVDLRDALSGAGDDSPIIAEVERGEDYLKAKYDDALADTRLAPNTLAVIREAYQSVRAGHDKASALKHNMEATS